MKVAVGRVGLELAAAMAITTAALGLLLPLAGCSGVWQAIRLGALTNGVLAGATLGAHRWAEERSPKAFMGVVAIGFVTRLVSVPTILALAVFIWGMDVAATVAAMLAYYAVLFTWETRALYRAAVRA